MNCLSHAFRFLHDPYLAAGTCVPDWLGMIDRKTRVRRAEAVTFLEGVGDPAERSVARGIVQHLDDDHWFHQSPAFVELTLHVAHDILVRVGPDDGMRPSFLSHILVELLLDSCVAERHPTALDDYYRALDDVDPQLVQRTVNAVARTSTEHLVAFLPRYRAEKFLYDYLEDRPLLRRLNGVMARVQLAALPEAVLPVIASARGLVRARYDDLLAGGS